MEMNYYGEQGTHFSKEKANHATQFQGNKPTNVTSPNGVTKIELKNKCAQIQLPDFVCSALRNTFLCKVYLLILLISKFMMMIHRIHKFMWAHMSLYVRRMTVVLMIYVAFLSNLTSPLKPMSSQCMYETTVSQFKQCQY